MRFLRIVGIALLAANVGCKFAPTYRDCEVRCASSSMCPTDMTCGSNGYCYAGGGEPECATIDAATDGSQAVPDAAIDAAAIDATAIDAAAIDALNPGDDLVPTGVTPDFACTCAPTAVTLLSEGEFVSTPRAYIRLHDMPAEDPVVLERVAFVNADTLTAVVPAGVAIGTYDLIVFNPSSDGRSGTLQNALRVVANPGPVIVAVVPPHGTPGENTPVSIHGENFRDPVKVELIDPTGNVDATIASTTPVSATQIDTTFPTSGMSEDRYRVRVTNLDEDSDSTYSTFVVAALGPSGNLHAFASESQMGTARRMLACAAASDSDGNRYLYAIGGDTGDAGGVLGSVEVSQVGAMGELGSWREGRYALTVPRVGAGAVAVPVFGGSPFVPTKTYLYVLGGQDDGGSILDTVERAVVLSSEDAPRIASAAASSTGGTLSAGTWYYRVSAVLDASDPDNPGGETLASAEAIVTIDASSTAIDLAWDQVVVNSTPAVQYRIYRSDEVNGVSRTEHLIATASETSFTDTGEAAGVDSPLPPGATGVWVVETGTLSSARWGHGAAAVVDGAGARFVFVVGGKANSTDAYLGSVEYASIDDADGSIGNFTTSMTNALGTARAFFGLAVETPENVSGFASGARLFAAAGVAGGAASESLEYSDVATGGGNAAWTSYGGAGSLQPRAGALAVITNEKLFALGGGSSATDTSVSLITQSGRDVPFGANGALDSPIQSTAENLLGPRALGGVVSSGGIIYFLGGTSNGTDALATTERSF